MRKVKTGIRLFLNNYFY